MFPHLLEISGAKISSHSKVKCLFYLLKVTGEICDNKPALNSEFLCVFSSEIYCGRGTIYISHIKSMTCQVYRIATYAATEINGLAGPDFSLLYRLNKSIRRCLNIPGNLIERYFLVNSIIFISLILLAFFLLSSIEDIIFSYLSINISIQF